VCDVTSVTPNRYLRHLLLRNSKCYCGYDLDFGGSHYDTISSYDIHLSECHSLWLGGHPIHILYRLTIMTKTLEQSLTQS
jgi:hypothetical protein